MFYDSVKASRFTKTNVALDNYGRLSSFKGYVTNHVLTDETQDIDSVTVSRIMFSFVAKRVTTVQFVIAFTNSAERTNRRSVKG